MMGLITESNDSIERLYIDWDENYGKSFKIVHTPEGTQSGMKWNPDLVSVVTPENESAWYEWEELSPKKLLKWKDRWDEVQKTLGDHKYNQIIRSMSNNQGEMMEDNNTRRTDIGRTMDTFTFDDSYDELLGSTYFKFHGEESFKWKSTGHKDMEERIFNSYLDKYGQFIVVNLTDK